MAAEQLIVFLKAPRPRQVKTRLARTLGAAAATAAYVRLLRATLERVAELSDVRLCFAPDDAAEEIAPFCRPPWTATPQGDGDLGARMGRAFRTAFREGAERVVIIGTDCPALNAGDIREAWSALADHDVVLGPCRDGGYWLVALREDQPALFDAMPWSTPEVLPRTLERAAAAGLRVKCLRTLEDVDDASGWEAFLASRDRP